MARVITPEQWVAILVRAHREMPAMLRKTLLRAALRGQAQAQRNVTTGGSSGLHVRTGRLRQSIRGLVRDGTGGALEMVLRAGGEGALPVVYARIHELGGVILPKRRAFLSIPLDPVKTAAGVTRYASPRDQPGLFLGKTKGGQPYLALEVDGQVVPQWLLRRRVTMPARPYLAPALSRAAAGFHDDLLGAMDALVQGEAMPAAAPVGGAA